jgi:hypothetical protein
MQRATGVLTLSLALSACMLSPGAQNRVQTTSPTGITILTDPALRGLPQARQAAKAHCARFGKNAVQVSIGKLRGGQAPVMFACRLP